VGVSALFVQIQEIDLDYRWQECANGRPGRCYEFRFGSAGFEKSISAEVLGTSDWQTFRTTKKLRLEDFEGSGAVGVSPGLQLGIYGWSGPLVLHFHRPGVVWTLTVQIPQIAASLGGLYVGEWRFYRIIR
jgi:hypothetical protein